MVCKAQWNPLCGETNKEKKATRYQAKSLTFVSVSFCNKRNKKKKLKQKSDFSTSYLGRVPKITKVKQGFLLRRKNKRLFVIALRF